MAPTIGRVALDNGFHGSIPRDWVAPPPQNIQLLPELSKEDFPCLTYTRDLTDWHDFIRRTPEEYEAWIDGASKECEILELKILSDMSQEEKPIFVDTNISIETLRTIADHGRT